MRLCGNIVKQGLKKTVTQACNMAQDADSESGVLDQLKKLKMEIVHMIEEKHLPCIIEIENKTLSIKILEGWSTSQRYKTGGSKQLRIRRREKRAAARFAAFPSPASRNESDAESIQSEGISDELDTW